MSKLGLDLELVNTARASAARVAEDTQRFIDLHTTESVERSVCRLLGIDGVNKVEAPMPNIVVDHLTQRGILADGAAMRIGNAIAETGLSPQKLAEKIDSNEIDLAGLPIHMEAEIQAALAPYVESAITRIAVQDGADFFEAFKLSESSLGRLHRDGDNIIVKLHTFAGEGTEDDPFIISTDDELAMMARLVNGYYIRENDSDH